MVNFISNYAPVAVGEAILPALTTQHKRILIIALAAFTCIAAGLYMVFRYCHFKAFDRSKMSTKLDKHTELVDVDGSKMSTRLAKHDTELVDVDTIKKMNLSGLVHELCERDEQSGEKRECSLQHLKDLIAQLKTSNSLCVLNTIPDYYDINRDHFDYAHLKHDYTPLQYWAAKGNLEAVQLLVNHGAYDYCKGCNKSALYVAAFHGRLEIVDYLLQQGANADIAFRESAFHYFIPKFIFQVSEYKFQISEKIESKDSAIDCFEKILKDLKAKPNQFDKICKNQITHV